MKIDAYQSQVKPSYGLIVPTGTPLESFDGQVGAAVKKLAPWIERKTNVELSSIAVGDLFEHLSNQITTLGAGVMKTEVSFTEFV